MRTAEDVSVKIICSASWLRDAQKQAYLAGVRTSIVVVKNMVEADEIYVSSSVLRALSDHDMLRGDLEVLLQNMNQYLKGTKLTIDIFSAPHLVANDQFRFAVIEVAGDLVGYYAKLGVGNFDQEKRILFFLSYLKQVGDLLDSL